MPFVHTFFDARWLYCAGSGPFAANQILHFDANSSQFFELSFAVVLPGNGVALLPVLDDVGGMFDERRRRTTVKPPTLHKRSDCGVNLANGYLRIFPPSVDRKHEP